jgi:hypothetical protein
MALKKVLFTIYIFDVKNCVPIDIILKTLLKIQKYFGYNMFKLILELQL